MSGTANNACGCGTCATCTADNGPGMRGLVVPGRTHAALKQRMLDAISTRPELARLTTRTDDDPAIALADAFAASLHVLSFYLERFHTEAYIETATEAESVAGLANMVGYRPRPAIAAGALLAFTLDDFPAAPASVPIRAGSKVQTIPGPEELPVVFETSEDLEARPAWNAIPAQRTRVIYPGMGDSGMRVRETLIAGRVGDIIAIVVSPANTPGANTFEAVRLKAYTSVRLDPDPPLRTEIIAYGQVDFDHPLASIARNPSASIAVFSRRASLFGYNATRFVLMDRLVRQRVLRAAITDANDINPPATESEWPHLFARRSKWVGQPDMGETAPGAHDDRTIDLDAIYPEAMIGRLVLLKSPSAEALFRIADIAEVSRSGYGISAKVTRLTLDRDVGAFDDAVRTTAVFIQTEDLHPADSPINTPQPEDAESRTLTLATATDLPKGRRVIVKGRGADGVLRVETATVETTDAASRTVTFATALANQYLPAELVLFANVAPATHGETKTPTATTRPPGSRLPIGEPLGAGDARRRNQAFALRQPGLTHVQAANPLGYEPALEVRVDDVLRPRADRLYGLDDTSQAYAVETAPDGRTLVRFAGRLRTGADNVAAVYRVGAGSAGNLAAGRLIAPMTIPLGLRSVTNPLATSGGVDAEPADTARRNAPVRIVSLDRIVSLADHEAFARAYGGIAKAQASVLWVAGRQVVHVSVAGPNGAEVAEGSDLFRNLDDAMRAATSPGRPFRLVPGERVPATVTIAVLANTAFDRKSVEAGITATLAATFAPDQRAFATPLAKSAILTVVQSVPGVIGARVDSLASSVSPSDTDILGARAARLENDVPHGAEYLTLDSAGVTITEFAP